MGKMKFIIILVIYSGVSVFGQGFVLDERTSQLSKRFRSLLPKLGGAFLQQENMPDMTVFQVTTPRIVLGRSASTPKGGKAKALEDMTIVELFAVVKAAGITAQDYYNGVPDPRAQRTQLSPWKKEKRKKKEMEHILNNTTLAMVPVLDGCKLEEILKLLTDCFSAEKSSRLNFMFNRNFDFTKMTFPTNLIGLKWNGGSIDREPWKKPQRFPNGMPEVDLDGLRLPPTPNNPDGNFNDGGVPIAGRGDEMWINMPPREPVPVKVMAAHILEHGSPTIQGLKSPLNNVTLKINATLKGRYFTRIFLPIQNLSFKNIHKSHYFTTP